MSHTSDKIIYIPLGFRTLYAHTRQSDTKISIAFLSFIQITV